MAGIKGQLMRIAFISDIHANFIALQAVIADIKSQSVDQIVCLGDTITLGPQPIEVLNALRELKCLHIKGNHDAAVLKPEDAAQHEISENLVPDLIWCKNQLSKDDIDFIKSFKPMLEIDLPRDNHILAFHGSPLSTTDIIQATTPTEQLDIYFAGQKANIFIGGHSHIQMVRRHKNKLILNSGSTGNAFEFAYVRGKPVTLLPWAEYMIISQSENSLSIDARRVYFDTQEVLEKVKERRPPCSDWWLNQYSK
jgi:predicted phosphodiesterase